jgi:two-component system, cell cycle sensor histidine kinase and response regulator CckA
MLLIAALHWWVIRPFRAISRSLRTENPSLLEPWKEDRGDVGKLGKVVRTFFEQREALVKEMHERRQAERSLRDREEELRHALKLEAVGRLAGGVAHDFNNLLTVIIGYATLLPPGRADQPLSQGGEMILKAAEKAAALTQQLLAFSRKQVLHPRVIDLNALLTEMQKLLHRTLGERIELRLQAEASLGRVRADATQLEQVIVNLAINARDAMPRGGVLTLATHDALFQEKTSETGSPETEEEAGGSGIPPGRYVVLSVQDTGTGIDKETQARIFEPFFTTKSPGRGTGLGLATVYGIVRQSGGMITVQSEEGVGTTFSVFLPQETAPLDPPPPPQPLVQKSTHRERILVVDDDRAVRELMCRVLENQEFTVVCAADCPEALEIASDLQRPLDLLITDIVMPIFTGPELAERIRKVRPAIPVLMVSGYARVESKELAVLEPNAATLEKPFTPQELIAKVFSLLARPVGAGDAGHGKGSRRRKSMAPV